jgi:hypothetical protein
VCIRRDRPGPGGRHRKSSSSASRTAL